MASDGIGFDRLFKVGKYYFQGSKIDLVQKNKNPISLTIYVGIIGFEITDMDDIQEFRTQYIEYFNKNGIKLWGDL